MHYLCLTNFSLIHILLTVVYKFVSNASRRDSAWRNHFLCEAGHLPEPMIFMQSAQTESSESHSTERMWYKPLTKELLVSLSKLALFYTQNHVSETLLFKNCIAGNKWSSCPNIVGRWEFWGKVWKQENGDTATSRGLNSDVKVKRTKTSLAPHPTPQLCLWPQLKA